MSFFTLQDPVTPVLVVHIVSGGVGIVAGAMALLSRKGAKLHRLFGTVFVISMLIMTSMGAYVAATLPATAFPRVGTAIVAVLTGNLAASGWMTVRRRSHALGRFEIVSLSINVVAVLILSVMALRALTSADGLFDGVSFAPYLIAASFAALVAILDASVARRGGIVGTQRRVARHLWRMCFALFLAASFFFIGQQTIMPPFWRGSPVLTALAVAPLVLMVFWLVRIRFIPSRITAASNHPNLADPRDKGTSP